MTKKQEEFKRFLRTIENDKVYPLQDIPGISESTLRFKLTFHFDHKNKGGVSGRQLKLISKLISKRKPKERKNDIYHLGKKLGYANLKALFACRS